MDRAEDPLWVDGNETLSELAPCRALDFRAKINRRQLLDRDASRLRRISFGCPRGLLQEVLTTL